MVTVTATVTATVVTVITMIDIYLFKKHFS